MAWPPISLQLLAADVLGTCGHSSKLYLFDADDAADSLHKLPVEPSESFVFDKDHPPSLASICMSVVLHGCVCCSNQSDIFEQVRSRRCCFPSRAQSPQHTVVLRCSDGFHRSCVMASALLLQLGALAPSSNADDMHLAALKFYYSQRGNPQSNGEFLTPSQIRFIKFFSDCLNAGIVTPSVSVPPQPPKQQLDYTLPPPPPLPPFHLHHCESRSIASLGFSALSLTQHNRYTNIFRMRRALREAEACHAPAASANAANACVTCKDIKLNDFVPATEEMQIACQQARNTFPLLCLYLSVTQPTFSAMLHRSSASGCRLCSAPVHWHLCRLHSLR